MLDQKIDSMTSDFDVVDRKAESKTVTSELVLKPESSLEDSDLNMHSVNIETVTDMKKIESRSTHKESNINVSSTSTTVTNLANMQPRDSKSPSAWKELFSYKKANSYENNGTSRETKINTPKPPYPNKYGTKFGHRKSKEVPFYKKIPGMKLGFFVRDSLVRHNLCLVTILLLLYPYLLGTSITVDAFKYGSIKDCTAYFLRYYEL